MRILNYGVFNKETNERVFTSANKVECEKVLEKLGKENFIIRHKWKSF